jgi:hypothetical protein
MFSKAMLIDIGHFSEAYEAMMIGRQVTRAGVIGGLSTLIFGPFVTYFLLEPMYGITPEPWMIAMPTVVGVTLLPIGLYFYKNAYNGGRLLSWTNKLLRIFVPVIWLSVIVPAAFLPFVPRDPVLLVYVGALSLNVAYLIWFARWTRKTYKDWEKANQVLSSQEFAFAPRGERFSFMLREIFAMPPAYLISRPRAALVVLLIIVSLLLEGLTVSYLFHMNQNLQTAQWDLKNIKELTDGSLDSRADILGMSIGVVIFPFLSLPTFALAGRFRRAARRAAVYSVAKVRAKDMRPPLLLLRPFRDDQIAVPQTSARNMFERILTRAGRYTNVDELLTERYWHVGPVFAIGNPNDSLPPLGAARAYLKGADWRTAVSKLMEEARAIVVGLDDTEGIRWELEQARASGHLLKALFLVPPGHRTDHRMVTTALHTLGFDLDGPTNEKIKSAVAFLPISTEHVVILQADRNDSSVYDLAVRIGLHTLLDGGAERLAGLVGQGALLPIEAKSDKSRPEMLGSAVRSRVDA